jgi:ElaA protein
MIHWSVKKFDDLSALELYKILKLRIEVFMIEQACLYPECDDKDLMAFHLTGYEEDQLVAYLRILPEGTSFKEASLGRVIVNNQYRQKGVGNLLLEQGLTKGKEILGVNSFRISAQNHLRDFYAQFGFQPCSEVYLEDNIPHVEMLLI